MSIAVHTRRADLSRALEAVRSSSITAVLEQHVAHPARHRGNWPCPNPEHNDDNPSCSVDEERGLFNCFGCEVGGGIVDLLALVHRLDPRNRDDLARIIELAGCGHLIDNDRDPETRAERDQRLRKSHLERRQRQADRTAAATPQPIERNPAEQAVEPTDAPEALAAYLAHRQWPEWVADHYQLHPVRRHGNVRIRHPFLTPDGQTLTAQDYQLGGTPKWLTVTGGKGVRSILFGLPSLANLADDLPRLDLCEGPADAIAIGASFGPTDRVVLAAPGSQSWRKHHAAVLARCFVVVWADNDDAGKAFFEAVTESHQANGGRCARGHIPERFNDVDEWRRGAPESFAGDFRVAHFTAWKSAR